MAGCECTKTGCCGGGLRVERALEDNGYEIFRTISDARRATLARYHQRPYKGAQLQKVAPTFLQLQQHTNRTNDPGVPATLLLLG